MFCLSNTRSRVITRTTEAAFRILVYLETHGHGVPVPLQHLAKEMGGSPSYLAKVANLLVRGGILESQRGAQGGLLCTPATGETSLLRVVEICQGMPEAAYCETKIAPGIRPCSYHVVMADLHAAIIRTLGGRTVSDLARRPHGCDRHGTPLGTCRMCHGEDCTRS
jgi:Rrf2 family protein